NHLACASTRVFTAVGTLSNNSRLALAGFGPSARYPSSILVYGLTSAVQQIRVTLTNLSHTFPDDLDILLVSPNGRAALLMSDAGGEQNVTNVVLRFDDQALLALPDDGPISSGTYRPTDYVIGDFFPAPAPPGPY